MCYLEQIALAVHDVLIYGNGDSKKARLHREKTMVRNFKLQVRPDDIVYAQFGAGHIAIGDAPYFRGFMAMVLKDPQYKGRTLSIGVNCYRCQLGTSTTAYKPYQLNDDGSGYRWNDRAYHLDVDNAEQKQTLIESLGKQSTAIDMRQAKPPFDKVKEQFQYVLVMFD
ncbi:MAG: hypothetical protein AAFX87_26170 [Bacteroidota bacterium]